MYADGLWGAAVDRAEAVKWYRKAADQGSAVAATALAKLAASAPPPSQTNPPAQPTSETTAAATPEALPNQGVARMSAALSAAFDEWLIKTYLSCWTPPTAPPGGERYMAEVRVDFNADGTLASAPALLNPPSDPAWRAHAESAVRAVLKCNPLHVPPEYAPYYEQWRTKTVHFDPQSAMGAETANAAVPAQNANRPSFDCATAKSGAARLICSDAELSKADADLGKAFHTSLARLEGADKSAAIKDQVGWIHVRNTRCGLNDKENAPIETLAAAKGCTLEAMQSRITKLAGPNGGAASIGASSAASVISEAPASPASASVEFQSVGRKFICERQKFQIGGCGYACTPFFSKEVIIALVDAKSTPKSDFAKDKFPRLLEFLKEDGRQYCAKQLLGRQLPESLWILEDAPDVPIGMMAIEVTFNGRNPGWEVTNNSIGKEVDDAAEQAERDRLYQIGPPLQRGKVTCQTYGPYQNIDYAVTVSAADAGILADPLQTVPFLEQIRKKNAEACHNPGSCDTAIQNIKLIRAEDNGLALDAHWIGRLECGQQREWQYTNYIALKFQQDLAKKQRETEKAKIIADLGYQQWVQVASLSANPFIYKGSVVGSYVRFARMLSESDAVFTDINGVELFVSGVPATLFHGAEAIILSTRINGTKAIKTAGGEVALPYGDYVNSYKCVQQNCAEVVDY
jgi:uncharacterized protein YecT (DUF1311 family)